MPHVWGDPPPVRDVVVPRRRPANPRLNAKRPVLETVLGWAVAFGGQGAIYASDYYLRWSSAGFPSGTEFQYSYRHGWNEFVVLAGPVILMAVGAFMLIRGSCFVKSPDIRAAVILVQLGVGFILYVLAGLGYVTGTGIDSL